MLNNAYFSDPLTTETFDRTLEQRAARAALVSRLHHDKHDDDYVQQEANRQLFIEFAEAIEADVDERAQRISATALERHETLSDEAAHMVARMEVMDELARLHEELPLPGLERIAAQYDNA